MRLNLMKTCFLFSLTRMLFVSSAGSYPTWRT